MANERKNGTPQPAENGGPIVQYALEKHESDLDKSLVTSRTLLKFYPNGKLGVGITDNGFETLIELDYTASEGALSATSESGKCYPLYPNEYGKQVIAMLTMLGAAPSGNFCLSGIEVRFADGNITVSGDVYGSEADAAAGVNKTETKVFGTFEVSEEDAAKLGLSKDGAPHKKSLGLGRTIKAWFKDLMPKKQKDSKVDVKLEKVPIWKTFRIFKGIKLPWVMIALSFVIAITGAIVSMYTVQFTAEAIDASGNLPTKQLTEYALLGSAQAMCLVIVAILQGFLTNRINHDVRTKLWNKMLKIRQNDLGADGGESLVSRITIDSGSASTYFSISVNFIRSLTGIIVYVILMFQISVKMAGVTMIFVPVSVGLGYLMSWLKYRVALKKQGFVALSTAYLVERTKDLALIKTCNTQQKEIDIGNEYFDRQYANQLHIGLIGSLSTLIDNVYSIIGTVIPYAFGAVLVASGELTTGFVVAFSGIISSLKNEMVSAINYVSTLKEANGMVAKAAKILDYPEEELDEEEQASPAQVLPPPEAASQPVADGAALDAAACSTTAKRKAPDDTEDIVFENVTFGYTANKTILNGITFTIPKKKDTAILGKNGSGKTTSFKLIERLYDPDGGAIKFGDDDIAEYTLSSWRDKICLVAQGGALMTGTLRSNICYGRDDVTDEEFEEAVKLAHVADFAEELPLKYDSPVAVDGSNYSGGQRQCIAIARAMLSKKPIMLLDEATCNLDAKREKDVMNALENLIKDRTTVIIAHSLGTVKHADYVVVLNNGKVESTGTPADIMKQTDNYLQKMMKRASA